MAQRRTTALGSGVEFADHREYTPGDDFRYLDWNLYARHDELLLKRFEEEEDLHVYFLLDCSRSMAFGDPPKFDFARRVAAALAYIALADLDRIAVTAFANDIVADFPLTRGKGRVLSLLTVPRRAAGRRRGHRPERVATGFVHRDQRRGWWSSCSDLYDPKGFERGLDISDTAGTSRTSFRCSTSTRRPAGHARRRGDVGCRKRQLAKVTVTEKNLRQYRKLFAEFQEGQGYCTRYGLGCTRTSTTLHSTS
jgi:uncharacterized protein (DUF58 family)